MRGEKEIEEIKTKIVNEPGGFNTENSRMVEFIDWVLEGEPRYSIAELEKLIKYMVKSNWSYGLVNLIKREPKKVKEILR